MRALLMTKKQQGGWQPGANTIAYYPLTSSSTVNEMKGSGILYNLTNYGSTSFGVNQGVDCASFNGTSNTGLYNTSMQFESYPMQTVAVWFYITGTSSSTYQTIYRIGIYNNNAFYELGSWYKHGTGLSISQWTIGKENIKSGDLTGGWHLLVNTTSGTSSIQYIDGVVYQTYINSLNGIQTGIYIGKDEGSANKLTGYLSKLIVEDKARTQQEVSDYYNQTKSLYDIS